MRDILGKTRRITKSFADEIAYIYPYILLMYGILFFSSLVWKPWDEIIYWNGLHISVLLLSVIVICSPKGRSFLAYPIARQGVTFKEVVLNNILAFFKVLIRIPKVHYVRMAVIAAILAYAMYRNIEIIEGIILVYALISILFVFNSRFAAGIALLNLIAVPFLLINEKNENTERFAVYAFYFLVITVFTQAVEQRRDRKEVIHTEEGFKDR